MSTKPRLVLHIGTEKTGTTAIQEFLRLNTKRYADKRVIIPNYLGWQNHHLFACCFYSDQRHDDISQMNGMEDKAGRVRKRVNTLNRLKDQVSNATSETFIISSELIHSRLTQEVEIETLFMFVSSLFDSVDVVSYIRNPLETALSSWSTQVKYGSTSASLPAPSDPYTHNLCMHKESILRWNKYFGDSNVHVRLFRKDILLGNDLIRDFTDACGIGFTDKMMLPPKVNERLGYDGILFLSQINKLLGGCGPFRRNLISYFEHHFASSLNYIPSMKEFLAYSDYYNHSDQWVKENYFPDFESLWGDSKYSLLKPQKDQANAEADRDSIITQRTYSHEEVTRLLSLFADVWKDKNARIISLELEAARKTKEIKLYNDLIKEKANTISKLEP